MINEAFESKDEGYDIRFEVVNLTKKFPQLKFKFKLAVA